MAVVLLVPVLFGGEKKCRNLVNVDDDAARHACVSDTVDVFILIECKTRHACTHTRTQTKAEMDKMYR